MLVTHSKAEILVHSLCSLHLAVFDTWYIVHGNGVSNKHLFLLSRQVWTCCSDIVWTQFILTGHI